MNLPNTGGINLHATLLVTKTLLIAGEGWGGAPVVRAYDKKTGDVVSEVSIPGMMGSMPMTYMANGKQYIAFTVGTATRTRGGGFAGAREVDARVSSANGCPEVRTNRLTCLFALTVRPRRKRG